MKYGTDQKYLQLLFQRNTFLRLMRNTFCLQFLRHLKGKDTGTLETTFLNALKSHLMLNHLSIIKSIKLMQFIIIYFLPM